MTEFDRRRFLDLHRRMVPVNRRIAVVMALALVPWIPQLQNRWAALPIALALLSFLVLQAVAVLRPRPELWVFFALLAAEVAICASIAMESVHRQGGLFVLLWPVLGLSSRFGGRALLAGTCFALALYCGTYLLIPGPFTAQPGLLFTLQAGIMVAAVLMSSGLRESDVEHRAAAVLDPLTSMLNRHALNERVREVTSQAQVALDPVALIITDIDHFKRVNDEHGHDGGDAVLAAFASRLRSELRAYDLAYRLGGEEFAIVLPGSTRRDAAALAEQLRDRVAEKPCGGVAVTASFGVAGSDPGTAFDWSEIYMRADAALYAAKRAGRDRVAVDGETPAPAGVSSIAAAGLRANATADAPAVSAPASQRRVS